MSLSAYFKPTLLAAALSATFPTQAQQVKPGKPSEEAKQPVAEVKIAGRYDPRRDDTASKIVVTRDEILKYGDTNLLDVMKRLPGVTVSGASGFGRGAEVRMRGLGSGYTQILLDGERTPAGFSLENIHPNTVERIEVLRAASAEFSTQSIAGTINVVLKRAVTVAAQEIKVGMGGGNGMRTPSLNLQMSDKTGKMSYSITTGLLSNQFDRALPVREEARNAAGVTVTLHETSDREKGAFDGFNFAPRVNWKLDNGDTVTFNSFVNLARFKRDIATTTTNWLGSPPRYPAIDQTTWFDETSVRSDVNWSHKLSGDAKIDAKVGMSYSDNSSGGEWEGYAERTMPLLHSFVESNGIDKGLTTTGRYATTFAKGHALAMGWDAGLSTRDDKRVQRERAPAGFPVENSDEAYSADVTRVALYAQDEWTASKQLSIYVGARWEGIRTSTEGTTFAGAASNLSVLSPIFQTLYKLPGNTDQVRFAITSTFKAPGTRQLLPRRTLSVNRNSEVNPDSTGNPLLKPERAVGFDLSYEHRLSAPGALLSASTSLRRITDITRQDLDQGADGRWVLIPVNDGNATVRGLELEAKFPIKLLWKQSPEVDVRASLSRNWSKVDAVPGPNNRLLDQTPYSANIGLDYKLDQLTMGGNVNVRGGGLLRSSKSQQRDQMVRRSLEVYALWKFNAKTQLRATGSTARGWTQENIYTGELGDSLHRTNIYPQSSTFRLIIEHKM